MQKIVNEILTPISLTSENMVFSNMVYFNPDSPFPKQQSNVRVKGYVLRYGFSDQVPAGKIGVSKKFREFLILSLIDKIHVQLYEGKPTDQAATSINIKLELLFSPKERIQVDDISLGEYLKKNFDKYFVMRDQIFTVNYDTVPYILTIQKISGGDDQNNIYIGKQTKLIFIASGQQQIRLKSTKDQKKNIFSANFKIDQMGIGGLDSQLTNIFRRAFASRRLPRSIIQKFGLKHVKGILLYGPPGTGKTLIARQLAKSLKAKSLQIVNGPQIFSKYVGQSQQNIRKLFLKPRQDQKKYGDQSPLHILVFDEIDAICRQRGSDNSGTNAKDAVVNQILTNLDGVQALNNIVVIGMTNRKDLIDQAVLRPGRLQVHIEIGLPNEEGRKQILEIHTKTLKDEKLLNSDVNLDLLAHITRNYTGAELEAVVKNASSFAMTKGNDVMNFSKNLQIQKGTTVTMADFQKSLQEVLPSFGIDQQQFQTFLRSDLENYGSGFNSIMKTLEKVKTLSLNGHSQLTSILLYGPPGSGKTSIATHFAKQCSFPYIKLITPERYIGVNSLGKINSISRIFNDAYKSKQSLIVIDNIERLIEYVQIGPDFNNYVLQSLLTLIKRIPQNPDTRLFIIGTTSNYAAIDLLDINRSFNLKLKIPQLNSEQCKKLLGSNIGISSCPIKKLIQFRETVKGKPKSMWGQLWQKYG